MEKKRNVELGRGLGGGIGESCSATVVMMHIGGLEGAGWNVKGQSTNDKGMKQSSKGGEWQHLENSGEGNERGAEGDARRPVSEVQD